MKGYLQVYTGKGKGKSTASFGLAMRATGAKLKVVIIQFIKSMAYSEVAIFKQLGIDIYQYGRGCFIKGDPTEEDRKYAKQALEKALELFEKNTIDLLILDEINVAHYFKLFTDAELKKLLAKRPENMELVCTGRYAPHFLIEQADLVTEMAEIKHYYAKGVQARVGIER
ncbi:MAG: cob(I)yrinic acid a,c-diamide adenosyltransferase [Spirochaetales bacterium]|nr:cob(I)yrinic acid a,c-diamide adenosyltransferase [Spirochaetales bacterium]